MGTRPRSHATTLLLVEDEDDVREGLADILRRDGHHLLVAASATVAMGFLLSAPRLDLIITNRVLHGTVTGNQLVTLARTRRPRMPAIIIAGSGPVPKQDSVTVLLKPFKSGTLLAAIKLLTLGRIHTEA